MDIAKTVKKYGKKDHGKFPREVMPDAAVAEHQTKQVFNNGGHRNALFYTHYSSAKSPRAHKI